MTHPFPDAIGPYTISRELGRGGMGVVYLGRDTRLDRDVAIKALPEHLASDPDRLARFARKAKTLASLSHPNIAGIFGLEEHAGALYLVLEYVEGETLAEMLDRGPLPVDEALEIAIQTAAGVEAAHEAGVIHRDLKPGNIIITPERKAKVLDFGLARTEEGGQSSSDGLDSPTITSAAIQRSPTMPGVILGTAAYMSPEQARGRKVDKRSDVWSFGVMLYEMLTGASPFVGETVTDSIGATLHREVDFSLLPAGTPANVRRVVRRCLVRDKTRRLQSIGDARVELLDVEEAASLPAAGRRFGWRTLAGSAVGVGLVVGLVGVWLGASRDAETGAGVQRFSIDAAGEERILDDRWGAHFALSPDGTRLAITLRDDPERTLWVRSLDSDRMTRLLGNGGGGARVVLAGRPVDPFRRHRSAATRVRVGRDADQDLRGRRGSSRLDVDG